MYCTSTGTGKGTPYEYHESRNKSLFNVTNMFTSYLKFMLEGSEFKAQSCV